MEKIIKPGKHEYEEILRFIEDVFGHTYDFFPKRYPSWQKEETDFDHTLIIKEKQEIVSLVRIFPFNLICDGVKLKVGGIGSVSTSYKHRGKGYMTLLLDEAARIMKEEGFDISILWGDRHRYEAFGYETAGKSIDIDITNRGFQKVNVSVPDVKRYFEDENVSEKIYSAYNQHKFKKEREKEEMKKILKIFGPTTYYTEDGNNFGYVIIENNAVLEYGGKAEIICGILKYLMERFEKTNFTMGFPDFSSIPEIFLEVCAYWKINPSCMIKIINLENVLRKFAKKIILPLNYELTIGIKNGEKLVLKNKNGEIYIERGETKNKIILEPLQMVKLLFGTDFYAVDIDENLKGIIKSFLPFEIFCWRFDHI
jgi:predicted acetyltransferase